MDKITKLLKIELVNKIQSADINKETLNKLNSYLDTLIKEEIKVDDRMEDIIAKTVAKSLNIDIDQIFSKSRKREHVIGRFFCYKLELEFCKKTYSAIGKRFNRDHSTVIQGLWSLSDDLSTDYELRNKLKEVRNQVMHEIEITARQKKIDQENAKHRLIKKAYMEKKALHPSFGRPRSYTSTRSKAYNKRLLIKKGY